MVRHPGDPRLFQGRSPIRPWLLVGTGLMLAVCADAPSGEQTRPPTSGSMTMTLVPRPRPTPTPPRNTPAREIDWRAAVVAMGRCAFTDAGIDRTCAEARAFEKLRQGPVHRSPAEVQRGERVLQAVAFDLIRSHQPGLRHWAARRLRRTVHRDGKVLPRLLAQAQREKHPVVLKALVSGVVSGWRRGAVYRDFVITAGSHPAAVVRAAAMRGLGEMWGNKKGLRLLMERMKRDPDLRVRRVACRVAGQHREERLVAIYRRLLVPVGRVRAVRGACLEGVLDMWNPLQSWKPRRLSRRAYNLTLRVLRRGPYSVDFPSTVALTALSRTPRQILAAGVRTPAWYQKGAVDAILVSIALAPQVPIYNRGQAVSALARRDARQGLRKVVARMQGGTDSDSRYVTALARKRLMRKR